MCFKSLKFIFFALDFFFSPPLLSNLYNIPQQIQTLNKLVLDYSVKQVYGEAVGYNYYKMDISSLNVPIAPPQHSRPNNKQLELKNWF